VLRQLLLQVVEAKLLEVQAQNKRMQVVEGHTNCGIVIEGGALQYALHKDMMDDLMALCKECRAVVCCRVTPKQKADVGINLRRTVSVALRMWQSPGRWPRVR
jgi:magnesium-transporting ATPase (P-type)